MFSLKFISLIWFSKWQIFYHKNLPIGSYLEILIKVEDVIEVTLSNDTAGRTHVRVNKHVPETKIPLYLEILHIYEFTIYLFNNQSCEHAIMCQNQAGISPMLAALDWYRAALVILQSMRYGLQSCRTYTDFSRNLALTNRDNLSVLPIFCRTRTKDWCLTHCGRVMPDGDRDLGQHWLK